MLGVGVAALGVAVTPAVGVGVGAHIPCAAWTAPRPFTIDEYRVFPCKVDDTVPVLMTASFNLVMLRAPLQIDWAISATPETWGAAIDVPLMYAYELVG